MELRTYQYGTVWNICITVPLTQQHVDCMLFATVRTDKKVLEDELLWGSKRPCSKWATSDSSTHPSLSDPAAFFQVLTTKELERYNEYERMHPHGIYSLNQNPDVTCMQSTGQVTQLASGLMAYFETEESFYWFGYFVRSEDRWVADVLGSSELQSLPNQACAYLCLLYAHVCVCWYWLMWCELKILGCEAMIDEVCCSL